MFKKLLLVVCVCFVAFLVGCKGDDGEVGPKGDTGATGPAGPAGPAGEGGGGAFIFSTNKISGKGTEGDLSIAVDSLTADEQAFYDSGVVVLVYAKSLGVWWPLPGVVQFANNSSSTYTFVHGVEGAVFFVDVLTTGYSSDQTTTPTRSFDDMRVVLIPQTTSGKLSAEVNLKNYEETIKALGLSDASVKKAVLSRRSNTIF